MLVVNKKNCMKTYIFMQASRSILKIVKFGLSTSKALK